MHRFNLANVLLASVLLVSCAPSGRGNSAWDSYDYHRPKPKVSRDYDADYSLPTGPGCVDDAPGCY